MNRIGSVGLLAVGVGVLATGVMGQATPQKPVEKLDYNRDIRASITKCFTCHGSANDKGAAGLRLDKFDLATKKLASGHYAIVPGKPDESELIKRINASDDSLMPPSDTHKTLSSEEKQTLRTWIAQGAEYKEHWAFVKPVRPQVPSIHEKKWVKNPIDNFILAKIEPLHLEPNAEADNRTLCRRVTLDLTGLPPTSEEADAFAKDTSSNAYEKLVDRLLASPRYGERMAMDWMDYSRYADSNGFQADWERFQSRWRDWVLDAFNHNMPYDEFTVEQLAGDLLPNATMEQRLATGFNRNHRINTEGGVIAEEWRVENVVDRVETTSAVWLGLTAGCARCHDHKYDPLSQKDFYRIFAYFNNVSESGSGEERPVNHPPLLKAATKAQESELSQLSDKVKTLQSRLVSEGERNRDASTKWTLQVPVPQVTNGLIARYQFAAKSPTPFTVKGTAKFDFGRATGSIQTSEKNFADLGNVGDFERTQQFSYGAWIRPESGGSPFARMDAGADYRGWDLFMADGKVMAHVINKWPDNAMKVISKPMIPMKQWSHVFVTYDGSSKASGLKIYINGKQVETDVEVDQLSATIKNNVPLTVGRRTSANQWVGGVDDLALFSRALSPSEVASLASTHPASRLLTIPPADRSKEQQEQILKLFSMEHDSFYSKTSKELDATVAERTKLNNSIPDVMVMDEGKPRDAFVLLRGQYDKHGEKVTAGLPEFLPPMPANYPNNRLGLAKWIVSSDNPLTARVTVNRLWDRFFGQGIVPTIEDFGTRADFPSHPELLDYLATEFIRLKWNMKAMIKELVMSATYRQSSEITAAKLNADPTNKYLARGPRFRLPGEVIRDQALYASGLLKEKLGGPSVRPYMPDGIWDETNVYGNLRNYKHDKDSGLYRRSLYTIWKRTAAPPNMTTFDVPSRETCRVRRARTDTPLQALILMNDTTYLEAARVLGEAMLRQGGNTLESRLTYGFKRVLSRAPSKEEMSVMRQNMAKWLDKFQANATSANEIVTIGDAPIDKSINSAELAAYTLTASTLLNLDETINHE